MILIAAVALEAFQAEPNCREPRWQPEMNECAFLEYQAADKAMNLQWKPLLAKMKERDKDFDAGADTGPSYLDALLASQRAWLKFRDAHCVSEGYFARGGSMEPMVIGNCLEHITVEDQAIA
jgi:uncharacterized protein YecT (DUF1311 family)